MERYLEAADLALDAAMPRTQRIESKTERYTYLDDDNLLKQLGDKTVLRRDDGVVMFSSGYMPTQLRKFRAPVDGLYHVRVSCYSYQATKPIVMVALGGDVVSGRGETHTIGFFDAPAEKPTVIEFTDRIPRNNTFKVMPFRLEAGERARQTGVEEYEGPGLAVQWGWKWGKAAAWPATEAEVAPFIALVKSRLTNGYSFENSMRVGYKAILTSPDFLFLREKPGKLDDYALAARLSYFLWSSMPDAELLSLAQAGKLSQPAVLRAQTERLLASPKARAFTDNFLGQWLDLRQIDFTTPDKKLYPEYDELLKTSMVRETQLFFEEVLKHDLPVQNFIQSDFTMLNERLAEHYNIPA